MTHFDPAPVPDPLLTDEEHAIIDGLGDLANRIRLVIIKAVTDDDGGGGPADDDYTEAVHHIHALQNMILAQAAAREYPFRYRLLGGRIRQ